MGCGSFRAPSPMNRPLAKPLSSLLAFPFLVAACGPAVVATAPSSGPATSDAVVALPPPEPTATTSAAIEAACVEPQGPRPDVVNLGNPPLQDRLIASTITKGPVHDACERLAKRGAKAEKDGPGEPLGMLSQAGKCFASPKGAWALDPSHAKALEPDESSDERGWEVHYELTYVTPEGRLVKGSPVVGEISMRSRDTLGVEIVEVFDYDGDGAAEIVVNEWSDYGGESHYESRSILTFRDGEVKPYAPATDLQIDGVVDVDRDGRPDLVLPGPFLISGPCGMDGQDFRAPPHVAHSLPSGAFSIDDAVAREAVRAQCGPMQRDLLLFEREAKGAYLHNEETVRRITCARIYGMSPKEASDRVRARYPFRSDPKKEAMSPGDSGYCMSLKMLLDLAAQTPDFTTEAPCQ